ncbi:VOC family protein [Phaeobacter gallaeciensis]|uniref:VOC family protein n=1 Tax=Phaeobacter gallaeciensis TaxID=60890 RepID=UPI000BBB94E1|nr:VOC family protein [Phaeobacter gallaeciensis]ATF20609.1 Lactoylglutathione lyase [Phaeobacter gallaeciensis]ATF24718.1 Lactoylglutathione lyase [Phaeobacter gallaeciensis]
MPHSAVQAGAYLHHVAFESSDPERLANFYAANMDMDVEKISDTEFRCTGPLRRFVAVKGEDQKLAYAGLAYRNAGVLADQRALAEANGVEILDNVSPYFEDGAFAVRDNDGHLICFGMAKTRTVSYKPERDGIHAPTQHLTFATQNIEGFKEFYVDKLGFFLSDRVLHENGEPATIFTTTNHEHHTIACFKSDRTGVDHHSYEAGTMDNIKQFCDRFSANDVLLTWGPGRHGPGNNLFVFYTDPDGNWIEISGELETIYDRDVIDWPQDARTLNKWGRAVLRS